MSDAHTLERRHELGGDRHYIGDVALHCGDPMSAHVDGEWFDGRYEANWDARTIVGAWFYFVNHQGQDACARLYDGMSVRTAAGSRFAP